MLWNFPYTILIFAFVSDCCVFPTYSNSFLWWNRGTATIFNLQRLRDSTKRFVSIFRYIQITRWSDEKGKQENIFDNLNTNYSCCERREEIWEVDPQKKICCEFPKSAPSIQPEPEPTQRPELTTEPEPEPRTDNDRARANNTTRCWNNSWGYYFELIFVNVPYLIKYYFFLRREI